MPDDTGSAGRPAAFAALSSPARGGLRALPPLTLAGLLALAAPLAPGAEAEAQEVERPGEAQEVPTVRLESVEVLRVDLRRPVERPDAEGRMRTWEQAFMVRLALPEPPAMGPAVTIFLDGEAVPEHGGWERGIYFWVYDPARLEELRGRTISYRFSRAPRREIGTLEFGDLGQLRRVAEEELRER